MSKNSFQISGENKPLFFKQALNLVNKAIHAVFLQLMLKRVKGEKLISLEVAIGQLLGTAKATVRR